MCQCFNCCPRLAKVKADAKRKREQRELDENLHQMELQRRQEALEKQFSEWDAGVYYDGRVELALVGANTYAYIDNLADVYHFYTGYPLSIW